MDPDLSTLIQSDIAMFSLSATHFILLGITIILAIIDIIISGSEVAFFSLSPSDIEKLNTDTDNKSIRVSKLIRNQDKLMASLVVAYNFLNISIVVLSFYLLNLIPFFNGATNRLFLEIVVIVTFLLLFVEIIPKSLASNNSLKFSKRHALFIQIIHSILKPVSTLLVRTSKMFSKTIIKKRYEISMDELSKALEITSNQINHEHEKDMLEGIIRFKDKEVEDILVSRTDMVAIEMNTLFRNVIKFIVEAGFSRIPVYEESPDNIKGILYVKDLLPHLNKADNFRWQSLIRPAYFVPGTKRIDDLLEEFRANKNHMAIVVDEYGGTTGIVTMEDILEEIVGDISDEYDEEEKPSYVIAPDGSYIFEGKTNLEDFFKITGVPEADFEDIIDEVDTVAGLMLEMKEDFPKRKEIIEYKKYTFQAEEMNKRRIVKVRFYFPKDEVDG